MNQLKCFAILIVLFFASCGKNEQPDMEVQLVANWEVGDEFQYKFSQIKEEVKFEINQGRIDFSQIIKLKVLEKTEEGYKMEWLILKGIYPEGVEMDVESTRKYEEMIGKYKIQYLTNELGNFKELLNWEEVLNYQLETMSEVSEIIEEEEDVDVDELIAHMRDMYGTKEFVENLFIKELKLFHSRYGMNLSTKRMRVIKKAMPSIFGVPGLEVDAFISIHKIDTAKHNLVAKEIYHMDKSTGAEMVFNTTNELIKTTNNLGMEPELSDLSEFDIKDEIIFEMDYELGVMQHLNYKRNERVKSESIDIDRFKEMSFELMK